MIHSIEMLRGIAVLLVVIFHLLQMFEMRSGYMPLSFFINGGYAGVDIFFVISGYVMAISLSMIKSSIRQMLRFCLIRLCRIFSLWLPVFSIYFFGYYFLDVNKLSEVDLFRSLFLLPQAHQHNLLAVTWSLSYELYFYALVSLLILFQRTIRLKLLICYAFTIVALRLLFAEEGVLNYDMNILDYEHSYPNIVFSAFILEFCLGFLAFELGIIQRLRMNVCVLLFGIFLFLAGFGYVSWVMEGAYLGGNLSRVFFFGVSATCILFALVNLEKKTQFNLGWVLTLLGRCSYSLYLLHIFVFWIYFKLIAFLHEWTGFSFYVVFVNYLKRCYGVSCWISLCLLGVYRIPFISAVKSKDKSVVLSGR